MSVQPTYRPLLELLEQRELLSGTQAYVSQNNLYVLGTSNSDFINIAQTNNQISVTGAQINLGYARVNSVNASSIAKVFVYSYEGNDFINLGTLKNDATIYGGAGNDIVRCGLGNDTVVAEGGFDTIFRPYDPNTPIVNGATVTDIHQGQAPVCQTAAALAEAALQGHNFANDIRYLGNHLYEVKLYGNLPTQRVSFDGWTTSNDPVTAGGEFWTVLMQRARLQALGLDPTRDYTSAEWNTWNQKTGGRLFSTGEALYDYTGSVPIYNAIGAANPQTLQSALTRGDYVLAQSHTDGGTSADGVIANHTYAVMAVFNDAGVWKVRLYNPWGTDRENGSTMDALDKSRPAANDGIITLSWQQFTSTANFKGFFVAPAKK
jgi:hypothetical protein